MMKSSQKKCLSVKNLNVSFSVHGKTISSVRDLSFTLFEGQKLAIVGESGSGKSTLVRALLKLLPTNNIERCSGSVMYHGTDLFSLSEKEWGRYRGKEIGMIFQDPVAYLNPTIKIGKQLAEVYRLHNPSLSKKIIREKSIALLDLVGISHPSERCEQYPFEFSGGMCQRFFIALALAAEPKILIADEPTTALDVIIQSQILDLLSELQERLHMSIIFITHDLSLISGFCDDVLVMYGGKIVESAPTDTLFKNPQHPYTQKLLKSIPQITHPIQSQFETIEGNPPDLSQIKKGCSFMERCPAKMAICKKQSPPLFTLGKHKKAACWLHDCRLKE